MSEKDENYIDKLTEDYTEVEKKHKIHVEPVYEYGYVTIPNNRTIVERIAHYLLYFNSEAPTTTSDFICNFVSDNSIYSKEDITNNNLDTAKHRTDYIEFEYNDAMDTCGCPLSIIYRNISYGYKEPMIISNTRTQQFFHIFLSRFPSKDVYNKSITTSSYNSIYKYIDDDFFDSDYRVSRQVRSGLLQTTGTLRTVRVEWKTIDNNIRRTIIPDGTNRLNRTGDVLSILKLNGSTASDRYIFAYDPMVFTDKKSILHILKTIFYPGQTNTLA